MTDKEFVLQFLDEFSDLSYLHTEWKAQYRINYSFIQYLVETVFQLVTVGKEHGFNGERYSEEDNLESDSIARYERANRYVFDYFKKNKELLTFILL